MEIELEALLRTNFPLDQIEPVGNGELGGDILQKVNGQVGAAAGTILWEFKSTRNWNDAWLAKLREDQRSAKADVALIVSQALPKGMETFDLVEGVWIAHPRCAVPVAVALRQSLVELSLLRRAQAGQQTKMEQIYDYLITPRFRLRIESIVEKFEDLKLDMETRSASSCTGSGPSAKVRYRASSSRPSACTATCRHSRAPPCRKYQAWMCHCSMRRRRRRTDKPVSSRRSDLWRRLNVASGRRRHPNTGLEVAG